MDTMCGRGLRHALISARCRHWILVLGFAAGALSVAPGQAQEMCGGQNYPFPFTDVSGVGAAFCPGIMEAYVTGISKGTSPTTFSPNNDVPRLQMTTFLQRTVDQVLTRGSRRAALNQWWTSQANGGTREFTVPGHPTFCAADGQNIWVGDGAGNISAYQASTRIPLGTWTGAGTDAGILIANGYVIVASTAAPGALSFIDPSVCCAASPFSGLGNNPVGIAFDGLAAWTANSAGSVSKVDLGSFITLTVTTGFSVPVGILYDGAHIWVTDYGANTLLKLDSSGAIQQTVTVGINPLFPVFDGTNIWVPNSGDNSVTVVQASTGSIVATIIADSSNKLKNPTVASFDGERILITNTADGEVTLFKAADLSLIAAIGLGNSPYGACSDGINFWITDTFGGLWQF